METLGKKLRLLRHQKEWSQEYAAAQLGISVPAYSKIETGKTDINVSRLEDLAIVFDVTIAQLLTINDEESERLAIELKTLDIRVADREAEISILQRKVIDLYGQLNNSGVNPLIEN